MENKLENKKVSSLLLELSLPAIIGMLSSAIYNIVDRMFVGRINTLALSAVGITMPIQVLQMAFMLLIGIGSSTLISIKLGEGKKDDAEKILYISLKYIILILALFSLITIIFIEPIFNVLSVSKETFPYAKDYIQILLLGSVFSLPGYCLNSSLRSVGQSGISMKIILLSSILNLILDPLFIFTFELGIKGAAIATVISQLYVTITVIHLFIKGKNLPIKLKITKQKRDKEYLLMILKNGSPSFYLQIFATFVGIFTNKAILSIGSDASLASITIMNSIFSFYHMIIAGITQGNQPICGYNYGAKNFGRVRESLKLSLITTFGISMIFYIIIFVFPNQLISLFTEDQNLIKETRSAIKLYLLMLPFAGLHIVSSQYFQTIGKPTLSTILSLLRYGIILIPCLYALPTIFNLGITGIYISNAISDAVSCIIALFFTKKEIDKLKDYL
ncbi:MAG: MATE family efflux transporter [Filifactoraceae bacterium]